MRSRRLAILCTLICGLSNSCAVEIPNIKGCSGCNGFAGVGALCQNTLSDDHEDLDPMQWLDFLYARPEMDVPDPKNPTKTIHLPAKGPAVCFSSVDFGKLKTALQQLCVKTKCNYEQQKMVDEALSRIGVLQDRAAKRSLNETEPAQ